MTHVIQYRHAFINKLGIERPTGSHFVEHFQRFVVASTATEQLHLQQLCRIVNTADCIGRIGTIEFIPKFCVCQQGEKRRKVIVLPVICGKQHAVNPDRLFGIVRLIGDPGIPALHYLVIGESVLSRLQPVASLNIGIQFSQGTQRVRQICILGSVKVTRVGEVLMSITEAVRVVEMQPHCI